MMPRFVIPAFGLLLLLAPPARAEFVRGMYTYGASTYDTIASLGFNMVVSGPAWETDIVHARKLGLYVIPSWHGDDPAAYDLMRSLDADTLILAWYPFDEPDVYDYSARVVSDKIDLMRRRGLRKPVFLTVFSPAHYSTYLSSADVFGITPYPIGADSDHIRMDIVGRYTGWARILCPDKPLLVCIPVFFQRPWQYRAPDPDELHNIVYQALTGCPDGVVFFIWRVQGLDGVIWHLDEHPNLLAEMSEINRELIDLDALLTRGEYVAAPVAPAYVYHRVAWVDGSYTWIVANPRRETVTASIMLPQGIASPRILHGGYAELESDTASGTIAVRLGPLGYAAVRVDLVPRSPL
jgi:hypothetical protein